VLRCLLALCLVLPGLLGAPPLYAQGSAQEQQAADFAEAKRHFEQGEKHRKAKRYEKAIAEFREAYDLRPSALLIYNIAVCYHEQGLLEEARLFYLEYLAADPESPYRAEVEAILVKLAGRIIKEKPRAAKGNDAAALRHYEEGEAAAGEKRYRDAAKAYAAAYILKPSPNLLYNIAQMYWTAGDAEQARDYYERFLTRAPQDSTDEKLLAAREEAEAHLAELDKAAEPLTQPAVSPALGPFLPPLITPEAEPRKSRSWLFVAAGAVGLGAATAVLISQSRFEPELIIDTER
jgi:tetratricopeptide (TPR) repeat protein